MPCSENFNRYKTKYFQFLRSDVDEQDKPKTEQEVRAIASPKLMSKLSPISRMKLTDGGAFKFDDQSTGATEEDDGNASAIPITSFRSNRLTQLDKKNRNEAVEKLQAQESADLEMID